MIDIEIRHEQSGDAQPIYDLTKLAFSTMPFSEGDEQDLINALRADGDLALSLVAETDGKIVGHIGFSPVTISDGSADWYDLGPVSVEPSLQRQQIGSRLIRQGIAELGQRGARGIVLLGNPDFYGRFGFAADPALKYPGPPAQYFQRLVLEGPPPKGIVKYPQAFG